MGILPTTSYVAFVPYVISRIVPLWPVPIEDYLYAELWRMLSLHQMA